MGAPGPEVYAHLSSTDTFLSLTVRVILLLLSTLNLQFERLDGKALMEKPWMIR